MITIREFLDKLSEIWPHATEQEKQDFCDAFFGPGGVIAVFSAYRKLKDEVTKRIGGNK